MNPDFTRLLEEQHALSQNSSRQLREALSEIRKSEPIELAEYLDGECVQIDERIDKLKECIQGVSGLLINVRKAGQNYWPYSCRPDASRQTLNPQYRSEPKISISTQAMCCVSIEEILKANRHTRLLKSATCESLRNCITATCKRIQMQIETEIKSGAPLWHSGTFGDSDVFTASWMIRLMASWHQLGSQEKALFAWPADLKKRITEAVQTAALNDRQIDVDHCLFKRDENEAGAHSLPLLKLVEAIKSIQEYSDLKTHWSADVPAEEVLQRTGAWFEKNLHRQMSFYEFLDFRFDAAELIFCLSGAILTGAISKKEPIIEDVLAVVREAQSRSVYWRPYRPMPSTSQGMVLLPLSIEVATALLTTLTQMERTDLENSKTPWRNT